MKAKIYKITAYKRQNGWQVDVEYLGGNSQYFVAVNLIRMIGKLLGVSTRNKKVKKT